jgi:DNA invertase Pin-like site-specific DNA recombinase
MKGVIFMPSKPKKKSSLKIGVIYARYSSRAQKDASIEQQVREAQDYAEDLGIIIQEIYADRAVTGRTDQRPSFQRMMQDAEKGKFQYVIAWKSNRMGRNMLQAMVNESKLQELGIRVLYTEEDFDDTAAGRFALRSMMNVNQFYSENMAEDVRRGMRDNAENCKVTNGLLPFGYKKDEDLHYIIDEPKDAIVREIFSRVACREPFVDIANDLNARGIKTALGRPWGKNSFHSILRNERYCGIYIYDDIRIEDGIPRIISDELFFKVQKVLKMKREVQGRHQLNGDYLLTGKLFCGKCKGHMVGTSGTSKTGEKHFYYMCMKRRQERTCNKRNIRRDAIEDAVAQAIKEYALQDDIIEWIADSTVAYNKRRAEQAQISILEGELAETKRGIHNIMTAIEQGIITSTTKERLMELEDKQAQLNAQIAAARADIIIVSREDIIAGLKMYRDGNLASKKYQAALFDTFLVAVYVYDNDLKIIFSFSGTNNTISLPFDPSAIDDIENTTDDFVRIDASMAYHII